MEQVRVEVPGRRLPTSFVRMLESGDQRPFYYSELTGPAEAFEFSEPDRVRVVNPELVTMSTFRLG
jgi:hypothetical protein